MDAHGPFRILIFLNQQEKVRPCAAHLSLLFSEPSQSCLPLAAVAAVAVVQTAHTAVLQQAVLQQAVRAPAVRALLQPAAMLRRRLLILYQLSR